MRTAGLPKTAVETIKDTAPSELRIGGASPTSSGTEMTIGVGWVDVVAKDGDKVLVNDEVPCSPTPRRPGRKRSDAGMGPAMVPSWMTSSSPSARCSGAASSKKMVHGVRVAAIGERSLPSRLYWTNFWSADGSLWSIALMAEGESGGNAAAQNGLSMAEGVGTGTTEVATEGAGAGAVATKAMAEGTGMGAIDVANRRSNHAFCWAKSLRISLRRSLVEGFMVLEDSWC